MSTYSQETRLLSLATPLGKDVLVLSSFTGAEEMSRLYSYQLEMFSAREDVEAKNIVGKSVTWAVQHFADKPRYFNGFVSRFSAGGRSMNAVRAYRAEVVPWLWFLTRTANCRIFQNKSVKEIIKGVFDDLGFSDYDLSGLKRSYPKLEYRAQYRETAFAFVSRLMEQFGIFYFFRHENGKHTLHLGDHKGAYKDCPEKQVLFTTEGLEPSHLSRWDRAFEFRPGKWAHTDYNFETPLSPLLTTTNTVIDQPGATRYEVFDYPGDYLVKPEGEADVKVHMEEEEAVYNVVSGAGRCCTFFPGGKFTLAKHDIKGEAGKGYVLTSVSHSAHEFSHTNADRPAEYHNTFTAVPDSVTFRPARATRTPLVAGPQPAVVVGPKGQEIYTDKYGRVKVQFFWDREGKKDENSSCWVRVAQAMAGKRWGTSFWPRIGQEVLVAFHEGDPDRPIIVGSVYNADQMPPYQGDGPDDKHKSDNKVSGYKSNTTLGGVGGNEWRFDDTKDKEQVYFHAEKNMDTRVKNDSMERVIHDRHLIVGEEKDGKKSGDQRERVYGDKHLQVMGHQTEKIEGDLKLTVGHGSAQGGNVDQLFEKKKSETVGGDSDLHVKKNHNEKVDLKKSLTVGMDLHEKVGMNYAHESGMTVYIKAGMTMVLEAGAQLSLKVGGSFIDINPTGVSISGPMVLINSGGAAGSGQAPEPTEPKDAKEAKPTEPTVADDSRTGKKSAPG